jgi:molybdenum cofactor cytidylyltransferase
MSVPSAESSVALLLLAAGGSTRMGRPKQLLDYHGRPLLRHSVEQALDSHCRPVIVVLGSDAEACAAVLHGLPPIVVTAINEDWMLGMGSSIRVGLAALQERAPDARAVVIALVDQPLITPAFLDRLARVHLDQEAAMVAASYDDQPGVPALFARSLFPKLAALDVHAGAKALLQGAGSELVTIPAPQAAIDVDTPEDYARLLRAPHAQS